MPAIEELLRDEFRRVTDTVQPAQLRPLRVPAPRPGWRPRLLPIAAGAAVIAIATVAALLAGTRASQPPPTAPPLAPAAMPRYYVTIADSAAGLQAVARDSARGAVTGTVAIPDTRDLVATSVTAAANERVFVIAAFAAGGSHLAGTAPQVFFQLLVSAHGRPEQPVELNFSNEGVMTGMALSSDGTMLALSMKYEPLGPDAAPYGSVEVINLATGATRTWTGRGDSGYWPGQPSWEDGDRTLAFTWWHTTSLATGAADIAGTRELDVAAPGSNLLEARLTAFRTAITGVQSAMITSGGRDIVASSCGDAAASGGNHGTAVARILEISAADGAVRAVSVLRTQTERFSNAADEQDAIDATCSVLSADPSGDHLLVQAFSFGRIDNGVFTALPGVSPRVLFVAAAW
jgi:hypothetical protein